MLLMIPELIVATTAVVVLVADLFLPAEKKGLLSIVAFSGLSVALVVLSGVAGGLGDPTLMAQGQPAMLSDFGGRFRLDTVAFWFKVIVLAAAMLTIALAAEQLNQTAKILRSGFAAIGEFYVVLLLAVSGAMFLASASDMVLLFVSLELATIPLYLLAAWRRDDLRSGEAGLKYVILGGLSTAATLFGLGTVYGLSGTTDLLAAGKALGAMGNLTPVWFAAGLVMVGVGFKLALAPFHMWAADVYEGAPTPVTAFLSVGSKAVGLVLAFQIFYKLLGPHLVAIGPVLAVIAALTMTLGNTVAILQKNVKRFMAYSSVSQAGYLMMGFLGGTAGGVPALIFYMLVYLLANLAVFGVIIGWANETGGEDVSSYKGMATSNPLMALAMMLGLFSLAGIPPLAGFAGKFFLFNAAAKAGYYWLVGLAAINSTVSLYYYLRIVREMYISEAVLGKGGAPAAKVRFSPVVSVLVAGTAVASVLLGVFPGLYEAIHGQTIDWIVHLTQR